MLGSWRILFIPLVVVAACTGLDGLTSPNNTTDASPEGAADASLVDVVVAESSLPPPCDVETGDPRWLNDALDVTTDDNLSCAVRLGGSVVCWGTNTEGRFGALADGVNVPSSTSRPFTVPGASNMVRVAASTTHVCAIDKGGVLWCWGSNSFGQLGRGDPDGSIDPTPRPVHVFQGLVGSAPLQGVLSVSLGVGHTCAVVQGGKLYCWGVNSGGHLGVDTDASSTNGKPILVRNQGIDEVAAAPAHTCAVSSTGSVECWGFISRLGGFVDAGGALTTSSPVTAIAQGARHVTAGANSTCAILDNGDVVCWGLNTSGHLGQGPPNLTLPTAVQGLRASSSASLSLGHSHTCIADDGGVLCLGRNSSGELGRGTTTPTLQANPIPAPVLAIDADGGSGGAALAPTLSGVSRVSAARSSATAHACALIPRRCASDGYVACWGYAAKGATGAELDAAVDMVPRLVSAP